MGSCIRPNRRYENDKQERRPRAAYNLVSGSMYIRRQPRGSQCGDCCWPEIALAELSV
jgi:hypothetical protein